jgi:hypothetical protein
MLYASRDKLKVEMEFILILISQSLGHLSNRINDNHGAWNLAVACVPECEQYLYVFVNNSY